MNNIPIITDINVCLKLVYTVWKEDQKKEYPFDYIFDSGAQQEDVFAIITPLLRSALDGNSVTILTYGETGE